MYRYDEYDQKIVDERVAQFRDQTRRYLAGELSDDEFRPLRLQNGLYIQRQAPMFRISIPYGHLASRQLRTLARLARTYDKGYAHFTTRQNVQFNWSPLEAIPDMLAELAKVEMHAIQTSGNCIRNFTSDPFAGVAGDELIDPRPWAEILRQWATFHPEFAYLPRKFKIAVNGAKEDRAVIQAHDIGLDLKKNEAGEIGFRVLVGGGLGRTPVIGREIEAFVPWQHILTYCESILRVYNRYGRRDNMYKARIKILVSALGIEEFRWQVREDWVHVKDGPNTLTVEEVHRVADHFEDPAYEDLPADDVGYHHHIAEDLAFAAWVKRNVRAHKKPGYASVTLSLKKTGVPPGDITAEQMELVADWADRFSFGEARVTHEQNLVLADVKQSELHALWQLARKAGLATPNIGLLTDIICCPGLDFCALANARSIPIAQDISHAFTDLDELQKVGQFTINISGCMNACGHHHVGHIGILGVDKRGEEFFQLTLGGSSDSQASLGDRLGPGLPQSEVPAAIRKIVDTYLVIRQQQERFLDTYRRVGLEPFKAAVYGAESQAA